MFRSVPALVVLLALSAHQANAIKCYQCNSKTNDACKDPMTTGGDLKPVECMPSMNWSPKAMNDVLPGSLSKALDSLGSSLAGVVAQNAEMVCMKLNIKSGEEMVTMRSCAAALKSSDTAAPKGSGICDSAKTAADGKAEYCGVCDYDSCNAAPPARHITAWMWLIIAPLISLLLKP